MDEDTKFRRALKNPIVVLGLCLIAGISVYDKVIETTLNSSLPDSVASLLAPTAGAPTTSIHPQVGHDEVATQWVALPQRDPFSPITFANTSIPKLEHPLPSTPSISHDSSSKKLILKAIAIETQQRSAVINRQVVYEGEMIEGYQVVSIELQGVWLQRHGKKKLLTFAKNTIS